MGRRAAALGLRGQRAPAEAAHARPLRQPHRRGRVPPGLPPAHGRSPRRRGCTALPWTSDREGAHAARAAMGLTSGQAEAGHGCPMTMTFAAIPALRHTPELHDEWAPLLNAAGYDPELRRRQDVGQVRHGDDREAGRLGRAREHDARRARRRGLAPDRPQVVLLGADVRRLPRPRPDRRGRLLLPRPAHPARRHAQRVPPPAPEGQARQPLERLERGRVRPDLRAAGRRARPRRPDDHRDGRPHAAGLRDRQRRRHALGRRQRDVAHGAPQRRSASCSPTSRSCRTSSPTSASSPRRRRRWPCASRARTTRRTRRSSAWPPRSASTGSASASRRWRPRRWSAWAATATSRSPACRACTARRR